MQRKVSSSEEELSAAEQLIAELKVPGSEGLVWLIKFAVRSITPMLFI